jgi:fatty acid/phospholipid biosynthesis enzyme
VIEFLLLGHLGALIKKHGSGQLQHLKTSIVSQLKEMREKATKTCNLALEHVKKDGESYFK